MNPSRRLTTLLLGLGALSACTSSGIGGGQLMGADARHEPVTFSWLSTDGGISGTMTATLPGAVFEGRFFQVTRQMRGEVLSPLWDHWHSGWYDWPYWNSPFPPAYPTAQFITYYSGKVVATLASADQQRMRCRFHLAGPAQGMSGGGEGECQLSDGRVVQAVFAGNEREENVCMNTLTKMALGLMGQLKPLPPVGNGANSIKLPPAHMAGGAPLMLALSQRQSQREFDPEPLLQQTLSDLLWAAAGVNRPTLGGRTVPSAMNAQEVDVYVALPIGLYRYAAPTQTLRLVSAADVRRVTGYQDFVDTAPLDLIFVADYARMTLVPAAQRASYASVVAGAMAQNVYLYCASVGLATVLRAWLNRDTLAHAMGLTNAQQVLLAQTVGHPAAVTTA